MSNATQENRQDQTDTRDVPQEGHATCISRRPSWADEVTIGGEAIDYRWTAPTIPESIEPYGDRCPAHVMVTREDMLYVNDEGVVLDQGPDRIFLIDANFDVKNARLLAAAIIECCDRIDASNLDTSPVGSVDPTSAIADVR